MNHTPGPWYEMTKGRNEYQSAICQEATGNTVALTYTSNDADASLIASAPDLLLVLKDCKRWIKTLKDADIVLGTIMLEKLDKAIAKAEGGA